MTSPVVACIGAGQLARMMASAAAELGITLRVLAQSPSDPAAFTCPQTVLGTPDDPRALSQLLEGAQVLTVEHELVPDLVFHLAEAAGVAAHPGTKALRFAQDKLAMRTRLAAPDLQLPMPAWANGHDDQAVAALGEAHGWPLIAKVSHGGYDGRGVELVENLAQFQAWRAGLEPESDAGSTGTAGVAGAAATAVTTGAVTTATAGVAPAATARATTTAKPVRECLVEQRIDFSAELAVMAARRPSGEIRVWPVVQTFQEQGQCAAVLAPAPELPAALAAQAQEIAARLAHTLDITGVFAIEMFLHTAPDSTPQLVINELAMRPHNSGHWTQDGCLSSQFEQHLRAILDLPLGEVTPLAPATAMANVLGSAWEAPEQVTSQVMHRFPQAKIHLYRKANRPKRKLGHVNVTGAEPLQALSAARGAADLFMGKTTA